MIKPKILFKLTFEIPNLDEYFLSSVKSFENSYEAELIIDDEDNHKMELKIYSDSKEYLGQKVLRWEQTSEQDLLKKIKVIEIFSPANLLEIDFSGSLFDRATNGAVDQETGKSILSINVKNLRKVHYWGKDPDDSFFYLNDTAFNLIECHYEYNMPQPFSPEPFSWEPKNKVEKQKFHLISFLPEHHFYPVVQKGQIITIKKEHRITVYHENLSEQVIKDHVLLLCKLYSFYCLETVTPHVSKIYANEKLAMEIKEVNNSKPEDYYGMFPWEFSLNPLNLINNVDAQHLISNLDFTSQIIDRFIYGLKTTGESRFMILYNILEQIRNFYILSGQIEKDKAGNPPNLNKVKEEYQFNVSKTKTDAQIQQALETIVEIVHDDEKEQFKSEIPNKRPSIKLKSMLNQFESFFSHIEIDPDTFGLDFKAIRDLRNDVFHGKDIRNKELLEKLNSANYLPKFTGLVIIKYLGIKDLNKITKLRL